MGTAALQIGGLRLAKPEVLVTDDSTARLGKDGSLTASNRNLAWKNGMAKLQVK
jgi:hypothetical protein